MARPERLGPYRIEKPIGKGGMGLVYSAIHDKTGERVAVKALSPELAMAEGFRERFEAEIESLKLLRHAGIVELYGYGEQDGALFYSMELVDGASLDEELRAGRRFTWREVAQIAIQVSRALKHAHDHGIIHRDIKPANILLDRQERVKLADFGIARLFGYSQLTTAGGILGTADYMSPEQADGRPVTDRCDQYSLGCVMYALLAGRPPFRANTLPEMLQMQRYAKPEPVRRYAPHTPSHMESVIAQLLSKSPADRFPNTLVLAKHLEAMTHALTRPIRDDFQLTDEELDEELKRGEETPAATGVADGDSPQPIELAETQVESTDAEWDVSESIDLPGVDSLQSLPALTSADKPAGDSASFATDGAAKESPTLLADGEVTDSRGEESAEALDLPATPPAERFTAVGQEAGKLHADQPWRQFGQFLIGMLLLAGVAYGVASLIQPPTADEQYATIIAIEPERWQAGDDGARKALERFESQFPDDPRLPKLAPFRQQLKTADTGRRLRAAFLRGDSFEQELTAEEHLYLDAVRLSRGDPDAASQRLMQLVELLSPQIDGDGSVSNSEWLSLVTLAKQQIEQIKQEKADDAALQVPLAEDRLKTARELQDSSPAEAAKICRAIIGLYDQQPWADEVVREAEQLLATIEAGQ